MFAPIIFYLIIYSRCQGASEDFCTCVLVPRNRNPVRNALAYELKVYSTWVHPLHMHTLYINRKISLIGILYTVSSTDHMATKL